MAPSSPTQPRKKAPRPAPEAKTFSMADARRRFTRPTARTVVCADGRLVDAVERVEVELAEMKVTDPARPALLLKLAESAAAMKSAERVLVVTALGSKAWDDLLAEHRPTDEHRSWGLDWNPQTLPPAAIAACSVDPKLTPEQVVELSEVLSKNQFLTLWGSVLTVNVGDERHRITRLSRMVDTHRRAIAEARSTLEVAGA